MPNVLVLVLFVSASLQHPSGYVPDDSFGESAECFGAMIAPSCKPDKLVPDSSKIADKRLFESKRDLTFSNLSPVNRNVTSRSTGRPNIVLVMADDQGWGQTGYYKHPLLKTPNLDEMARNGLRFDRFYSAAPVCSPTRASLLTGRTNRRTGVESHGYALRRQEKSIASLLGDAGYATAHFGKWHLNGLRGPGVPILPNDTHHPGVRLSNVG